MSVAKVIEITSTSAKSFEDAIEKGIARADKNSQERRGRVDQGAKSDRDGRQDQWLPRQHAGDLRARRRHVDLTEVLISVLDGTRLRRSSGPGRCHLDRFRNAKFDDR